MSNQDEPWWELEELRSVDKEQCKKIPILLTGNGEIKVPMRARVHRRECVCWMSNRSSWRVYFPAGTPFEGGKTEFGPNDPCGEIAHGAGLGLYKYDVTIENVTEDPWLDVGG